MKRILLFFCGYLGSVVTNKAKSLSQLILNHYPRSGLHYVISGDYWQQKVELNLCCKAGSHVYLAQQIIGYCATRTATVPQYLCSEF